MEDPGMVGFRDFEHTRLENERVLVMPEELDVGGVLPTQKSNSPSGKGSFGKTKCFRSSSSFRRWAGIS